MFLGVVMKKIKKIIISALLLASAIVINRFLSINTSILSIGFTFVPLMLSGIILGPKYSILIAGLADLIGALLFPFGAFFIGYTISALLTGLVYGVMLYRKEEFKVDKKFIIRLLVAILIVTIFINGGLNTLWLIITSEKATIAILPTRILKNLIMIPVMFVTMLSLSKLLEKQIGDMHD